jgi:hypothetical protein
LSDDLRQIVIEGMIAHLVAGRLAGLGPGFQSIS